jgi:hypothetical protein
MAKPIVQYMTDPTGYAVTHPLEPWFRDPDENLVWSGSRFDR